MHHATALTLFFFLPGGDPLPDVPVQEGPAEEALRRGVSRAPLAHSLRLHEQEAREGCVPWKQAQGM